jgi:hypothetical protein
MRQIAKAPPPPPVPTQLFQLLFAVGGLQIEDILLMRLMEACGSENCARLRLGGVINLHQCGYGATSETDAALNAYLLDDPLESAAAGHHVVSVHRIETVWVRIATNLGTDETTVRLDTPPRNS